MLEHRLEVRRVHNEGQRKFELFDLEQAGGVCDLSKRQV
jgi:hypothetical protein